MQQRQAVTTPVVWDDVTLRAPINWTGVWFFLLLGGVHLAIALAAFIHHHWEGYLSLAFAPVFFALALAAWRFRFEMSVCPTRKLVYLRHAVAGIGFTRVVAFSSICAVRRTLCGADPCAARVELLCLNGDEIEAPASRIPNQQALYFAMAIGVPLQKVSSEEIDEPRAIPAEDSEDSLDIDAPPIVR